MNFNLNIHNSLTELSKLFDFIEYVSENLKIDNEVSIKLNLFFEEQFTNIIKYGYDDVTEHIIELNIEKFENTLVCSIIDDGHPFNPLVYAEPDLDVEIEDRKIGGLGILLIKNLADNCDYKRIDSKNIFSAEFIIG